MWPHSRPNCPKFRRVLFYSPFTNSLWEQTNFYPCPKLGKRQFDFLSCSLSLSFTHTLSLTLSTSLSLSLSLLRVLALLCEAINQAVGRSVVVEWRKSLDRVNFRIYLSSSSSSSLDKSISPKHKSISQTLIYQSVFQSFVFSVLILCFISSKKKKKKKEKKTSPSERSQATTADGKSLLSP